MIEYYKQEHGLKPITKWEHGCWIRMTQPTEKELNEMESRFGLPVDLVQDVRDMDERPRSELEDGWLMCIVRAPFKVTDEEGGEVTFRTIPLAVLVRDDIHITLCYHRAEMLERYIAYSNTKNIEPHIGVDFLLSILMMGGVWYSEYLRQMNDMMQSTEQQLEKHLDNEQLKQMMRLEKFLIYFMTSLRDNELAFERMKRLIRDLPHDEDLLDDAKVELHQAYVTASIYSDILEKQQDGYSSIIDNNLNSIMKVLTLISVFLMLPTLIAGYLGMNVPNGMEEWGGGFMIAIVASVIVCLISYVMLKKSKLF